MTSKNFLLSGTIILAFAVIIGAFGAHALKMVLNETGKSEVFETAVRYHFYHGFALLFVGLLMQKVEMNNKTDNKINSETKWLKLSGNAFLIGIFLFCGSLYTLSLTGFTKLGMVAPLGGFALIVAWFLCAYHVYKYEM